jgi:hypothetical protein
MPIWLIGTAGVFAVIIYGAMSSLFDSRVHAAIGAAVGNSILYGLMGPILTGEGPWNIPGWAALGVGYTVATAVSIYGSEYVSAVRRAKAV